MKLMALMVPQETTWEDKEKIWDLIFLALADHH